MPWMPHRSLCEMGVSHNKGTLFWGPYNKDPTIWGTILGSPMGFPKTGDPNIAP